MVEFVPVELKCSGCGVYVATESIVRLALPGVRPRHLIREPNT